MNLTDQPGHVYKLTGSNSAHTAAQASTRLIWALRTALENAGVTADLPERPRVEAMAQACEALGLKLSEFVAAVEQTACPAWCAAHPAAEPATHTGEVHTAAGVTLNICQEPGQPTSVHLPEDVDEGLTVERARALGAALTVAARMTDEGGPQ